MNESDLEKRTVETERPFQRFERLIRGLVSVPKKEIEVEEARWR
jgi:hypothetical protein